ncbi:hypothetical protein DLH87_24980, partial [Vibrio parahaemolyticus]|nr:hypothetical protein [Vibrio parahaemolyticus]
IFTHFYFSLAIILNFIKGSLRGFHSARGSNGYFNMQLSYLELRITSTNLYSLNEILKLIKNA